MGAKMVPESLMRRSRLIIDSNRSPTGASAATHMPISSASIPGSQSWYRPANQNPSVPPTKPKASP